jgi:hypothetical protein
MIAGDQLSEEKYSVASLMTFVKPNLPSVD